MSATDGERTYQGDIIFDGSRRIDCGVPGKRRQVKPNPAYLHSWNGAFSWGSSGLATAATAGSILLDLTGSSAIARAFAVDFAADVLAVLRFDEGWELKEEALISWLIQKCVAELMNRRNFPQR